MGSYRGGRTQHALERAKAFFADRDFESELANELETTRQFLSGHEKSPSFSVLAHICETTSFRNCLNVNDIGSIDFTRWRLALELRFLQWRIDSITPLARSRLSWPTASGYLNLAISLCLTDRDALAQPMFQRLASDFAPVLTQMSSRKEKTRDWGAIAFVFQTVLEKRDVPEAFAAGRQLTLDQAQKARPTYSDGRDPYGSLLSNVGSDLIPVELVFMSRAIGHPDQELAELDDGIRATAYPNHGTFEEIDIALSIAGI